MNEDIKLSEDGKKVIVSERLLAKLKAILLGNSILEHRLKDLNQEMSLFLLNDLLGSILSSCNTLIEYLSERKNEYGINVENYLRISEVYRQLAPKDKNIGMDSYIIQGYMYQNKIDELVQLIDTIYNLKIEQRAFEQTRDLICAKEDILINMKYYKSEEEIAAFSVSYEQAIQEKNPPKMLQLLEREQQHILTEWRNFFGNLDEMTDENFCFLGHSTDSTKFDKDFYSQYVSCSLFNEDITDTYRSGFGFIIGPSNIVGAKKQDMLVNNYAQNEESLLHYSSIKRIDHPKRLLEECKKQQEENKNQKIPRNVYSEVIKDGFQPIGIFCFTDGSKSLNYNYQSALKLQEYFPHLKIHSFDIMKRKQGEKLTEIKLELINNLENKFTSFSYEIEPANLFRYDYFFEQFEQLKKRGNYTEEDIKEIFLNNMRLLSAFENEPDQIFDGRYQEAEIKFVLGHHFFYNIEEILGGKMSLIALNRLKKLSTYKERLNNYYPGLSKFVELVAQIEITEKILDEMKNCQPLNFYTMSKCLATRLLEELHQKAGTISSEMNQNQVYLWRTS